MPSHLVSLDIHADYIARYRKLSSIPKLFFEIHASEGSEILLVWGGKIGFV